MRFEGSDTYVATDDLKLAVNAALALTRPLLVKGEPGTGKTLLAEEIARALSRPLYQWHVKSTTEGATGTLRIRRGVALRDSQLGDGRVATSATTSSAACCGTRSRARAPAVVLIDEIDKADIEFPNDLLRELDRMEFYVYETQANDRRDAIGRSSSSRRTTRRSCRTRSCAAASSITSAFPDRETMTRIVDVHFPDLKKALLAEALEVFFNLREVPGLKKKPSTSELLDWLKLLLAEDIPPEALHSSDRKAFLPPLHGALLKNEQDVHLFERVVFMARAGRG
jgi:MoxR-like ATPase